MHMMCTEALEASHPREAGAMPTSRVPPTVELQAVNFDGDETHKASHNAIEGGNARTQM